MSVRTPKSKLSLDDLVQIEARARAVERNLGNAHQRQAIAYQVCVKDVPDLLVEIKRLRRRATVPSEPTTGGQDG